jgi:IstB-like ATP binding protein
MLNHPTLDQLNQLGLFGMAKAFAELLALGDAATLPIAEGLGLLLDRESSYRNDKRLAARLRYAKLRHQAAVEDIDYRIPRSLDRRSSSGSSSVIGSMPTTTSSSAAKPVWESHGSPARSATRPVATTAPCSMPACPSCSMSWRSPAATAVMSG